MKKSKLLILAIIALSLVGCETITIETEHGELRYARSLTNQSIGDIEYGRDSEGIYFKMQDKTSATDTEAIEAVGGAVGKVVNTAIKG